MVPLDFTSIEVSKQLCRNTGRMEGEREVAESVRLLYFPLSKFVFSLKQSGMFTCGLNVQNNIWCPYLKGI